MGKPIGFYGITLWRIAGRPWLPRSGSLVLCLSVLLAGCGGGGGDGGGGKVDKTAPQSVITFPTGGEVLSGVVDVTWTTTDDNPGVVEIALSNDGETYRVINPSVSDSGSFALNTLNLAAVGFAPDEDEGNSFRIKITPKDIPGNVGNPVETPVFTIDNTPPQISLTSPAGGTVVGGGDVNITWTTVDDNPGTVSIKLSSNSGTDGYDTEIDPGVPDTGSYVWDSSALDGTTYRLQVTATDAAGFTGSPDDTGSDITVDNTPPELASDRLRFEANAVDFLRLWLTPSSEASDPDWASDNVTDTINLERSVYYSPTNNISTYEDAVSNGSVARDWRSTVSATEFLGSIPSAHTMYWNVFVRDQVGNIASFIAQQPSGIRDFAFGTNGIVVIDTLNNNSPDIVNDAVRDNNGKIVVTGQNANREMIVWRFNADGTPDRSFGSGFGNNGYVFASLPSSYFQAQGQAVAIDSTGNIYIAGSASSLTTGDDLALWKFDSSGNPDTGFGVDGFVSHHNAAGGDSADRANAISVSDKAIIVAGTSDDVTSSRAVLWRFDAAGSLDTGFGDKDPVVPDLTMKLGYTVFDSNDTNDSAFYAVKVGAVGDLYVTGMYNADMALWRYHANGVLDISFGDDDPGSADPSVRLGYTVFQSPIDGEDNGESLVLDPDGKIIVTGYIGQNNSSTGQPEMVLWRYTNDGLLDKTFGDPDYFVFPSVRLGYTRHQDATVGQHHKGHGLVLDNAGKIIVTGRGGDGNQTFDMALWRFSRDGSLDTSFNGLGHISHANAAGGNYHDYGVSVLIDDNNKLIVVGNSAADNATPDTDYDLTIWRYLP
jgi:uncharacterized delta-60 repeat protein